MARGLVLSIVKKSCKKIVARCTIGVRTVGTQLEWTRLISPRLYLCIYFRVAYTY